MRGLNGDMAEWAVKKYSGHRMVPENIMALFDEENEKNTNI